MLTFVWQGYAHLYDGLLEVETYRDMLGQVAVLADCADRSVLDVGCGTGNVIRALIGAGAAHTLGVDVSVNMLNRARTKLRDEIDSGRTDLVLGDVVAVMRTLPDRFVDRITAVNSLYAFEDRSAFFRECRRVLTPDGFLLAAHTTRHGSGPIVRDQLRRRGIGGTLRPRLIGVAAVDLVIDLLALGGRYDFAPVSRLSWEAAAAGLDLTTTLGRCYGGDEEGINALLRISAGSPSLHSPERLAERVSDHSSMVIDLSSPTRWRGST